LDRCSRCGRTLQNEACFHSAGQAPLFCVDCKAEWSREMSKEALSAGRMALSGTLERLLSDEHSAVGSKQILSYALDLLERHFEKRLISRKTLETGELGSIDS
jgi:predicted amidophosphoribosyltransferase